MNKTGPAIKELQEEGERQQRSQHMHKQGDIIAVLLIRWIGWAPRIWVLTPGDESTLTHGKHCNQDRYDFVAKSIRERCIICSFSFPPTAHPVFSGSHTHFCWCSPTPVPLSSISTAASPPPSSLSSLQQWTMHLQKANPFFEKPPIMLFLHWYSLK